MESSKMAADESKNDGKKRPAETNGEKLKKKKPKMARAKHLEPAVREFRGIVQQCCKNNDVETAMKHYEIMIQNDSKIEAHSFYCLLSLCDGLGDRGLHVGSPKAVGPPTGGADDSNGTAADDDENNNIEVSDTQRLEYARRIQNRMRQLELPLNEAAFTALVKLNARTGNLNEAEHLISLAEQTQQCKVRLRLYTPLLQAYCCEHVNLEQGLRIWRRACQQKLELAEREYCSLLQCCGKVGASSSVVFKRVLSDLAENVPVPCHETTQAIVDWFESSDQATASAASSTSLQSLLDEIPQPQDPQPLGSVVHASGWQISRECRVNSADGTLLSGCLEGERLQPVTLSETVWSGMIQMNQLIATTGKLSEQDDTVFQGGGKGHKRVLTPNMIEYRQRHWKRFCDHLRPVDIVIDGANAGYFDQNFAGAPKHVNYQQIDSLVEALGADARILLILHSRHCSKPLMPDHAIPYLNKWKKILYQTPGSMNDDWFWLHAALKYRARVVTNDEMRDHHFQMVAPISFLKWRDRHQIHFDFAGDWKQKRPRTVLFKYPDSYTRRIQMVGENGLVIPCPKRGDVNRFLDGTFVAGDEEPVEETYVCIRPRRSDAKQQS